MGCPRVEDETRSCFAKAALAEQQCLPFRLPPNRNLDHLSLRFTKAWKDLYQQFATVLVSEMEQFFLAVIRRRHAVMPTMFYNSSTVPSTLELSSSGIPTPSTETPETWHIFTCRISGHTCRLCVIKTNQQHFPTQMLCVQGKRV